MTKWQAIRLRLWTLFQAVRAYFRGGASRGGISGPEGALSGELKKPALALLWSIGGGLKRIFRKIVSGLSTPSVAGFVLVLLSISVVVTAQTVSERYEARLAAAQDEISILTEERLAEQAALKRLAGEKAVLDRELADARLELAAARAAPPVEVPAKVVYRRAGAPASQCKSTCLFGWSF